MVDLIKMIDLLYPYQYENRINIKDKFQLLYYSFTIAHRPISFYLKELFPLKIEDEFLIVYKRDNVNFCKKFELLVRDNPQILKKILEDREIHRNKLKNAIKNGNVENTIEELFLFGRYGIEWYYPYNYLYERMHKFFTPAQIDEITNALKISDELPYFLEIWVGLEKVAEGEIAIDEFIEKYGVYGRNTLRLSKWENEKYLYTFLKDMKNYHIQNCLLSFLEKKIKKQEILKELRHQVDRETYLLLETFSEIDTENEIIHKERSKALRFLEKKNVNIQDIEKYLYENYSHWYNLTFNLKNFK